MNTKIKKMSCKQLGGACDLQFSGDSFEPIAEQSKKHGREMHLKGDQAHNEAMQKMQEMMQNREAMEAWFKTLKKHFDSL